MSDTLRKVWDVARSPWALFALSVLAAVFLAWRLNAGRAADQGQLAQLLREKDEKAVELAKIEGVLVGTQTDVADREARLAAISSELQAARKRIEELVGKVKILSVVHAWTAPIAVADVLRRQSPNLAASQGPGAKPESPSGACLLGPADVAAIQVQDVQVETRGGARFALGEAWLWRTAPTRARLLGGPWESATSSAAVEPVPVASSPGWGGGAWAAAGSGGAVAGPALALPPLWGLEATVGGGAGAKGAWGIGGSLVWRP